MSNLAADTDFNNPQDDTPKRDHTFYWIMSTFAAFVLLPTFSLDYGLLDSTPDEFLDAMAWSSRNIAWLWFSLPLVLLVRPKYALDKYHTTRHKFDIGYSGFCILFIIVSSAITGHGVGYSTILLFAALGSVMTLALARLEYMGGDSFVIGSLVTIIALISAFIIFPSIAIFIPMFQNEMGEFVAWQFIEILSQSQIIQIIINSLFLGSSVGITATFFGLIFAIYSTRIAKKSAFITRIFSILPIVTPPFVVGLGVTLMLGRSGYVTELMVDWFGFQNTNWLYGFTGIWMAQVLAFSPMSFMILDGAMKSLYPSL
jgi:iron(III) transport system permease protein